MRWTPCVAMLLILSFNSVLAATSGEGVVLLQATRPTERVNAIGVSLGTDGVVVACDQIADATSVVGAKSGITRAISLRAARAVDNICLLESLDTSGATYAIGASLVPGSLVTAVTADQGAPGGVLALDAVIQRKVDGGYGRVVYVRPKTPNVSLGGGALFAADGSFIGPISVVQGSSDEYAAPVVESLRTIGSLIATSALPKTEVIGVSYSFLQLASYYERTRSYEKSVALTEKWKGIDGDNPRVWVSEAVTLNRMTFVDGAMAKVERALKLDSNYLPGLAARLNLLRQMGRSAEAEIEAGKVLSQVRARDGIDEELLVRVLMVAKRNDEARTLAQQLFRKEPASTYANRAVCQAELATGGSADIAVDACKSAVEKEPDSAYAWGSLAYAYLRKGRVEDSISASKRALSISNEAIEAWLTLGVASEMKGDSGVADEAGQRIAELDPKVKATFDRMRPTATCLRQVREKALTLATTSCATATQLEPRNAVLHAAHGYALMREKRIDEGIVAHERALALDPKLKGAMSDLAFAYASKREVAKAKSMVERLSEIDRPAAQSLASRLKL